MSEEKIPNLSKVLSESTTSSSNSNGKPSLLAFTRAVNNLVYTELVSTQPTSQPIASLYGIRYFNANKDMSYTSAATLGGKYGSLYSKTPEYTGGAIKKGDVLKYKGVLYIALNDFSGTADSVYEGVMNGDLRMASEASDTSYFESSDTTIQETSFRFDKWNSQVKTRKLKTGVSIEMLQDLSSMHVDSNRMLTDFLTTMISEDINKDILQTLICVSKRFRVKGVTDKGYLDLSDLSEYNSDMLSYRLTRYVSEMASSAAKKTGFSPTYVVASSRVAAMLSAAGIEESDNSKSAGFLTKLGLELYSDTTTPFDYVLVGIKRDDGQFDGKMESVASLVFSPYLDDGKTGSIRIISDPDSLQELACISTRYALSVNPYATDSDDYDKKRIQAGDDWDNLAGRSDMSMFLGIKLPEISNADQD